ncbi:MAG: hypothetical protein AAGA56_26805, partial [Myxococcota bacterium]
MMQKLRRIRPTFRAALAAATTAAACAPATLASSSTFTGVALLATGATVLVGCEDPNAPETHVGYLEDPKRRDAAVKRIMQFYEDAITRDLKAVKDAAAKMKEDGKSPAEIAAMEAEGKAAIDNREAENVKKIIDLAVPPLVELFKNDELSGISKGLAIRFLADTRSPAAVPALLKAVKDYKIDDKRPEKYDSQMTDVIRNIGEMYRSKRIENNPEMSAAVFDLFKQTHGSYVKAKANRFYLVLNTTLRQIADPAWEPELIKMVEVPVKSLANKYKKQLEDQQFWQQTAATLLGAAQSTKAVVPLLKVTLNPFKARWSNDAMIALIRIGKPSLDSALKLMKGEDEALIGYAETQYKKALEDQGVKPPEKP